MGYLDVDYKKMFNKIEKKIVEMEEELFTSKMAADYLNIGVKTLYKYKDKYRLPAFKLPNEGGRNMFLYKKSDLIKWITKHRCN